MSINLSFSKYDGYLSDWCYKKNINQPIYQYTSNIQNWKIKVENRFYYELNIAWKCDVINYCNISFSIVFCFNEKLFIGLC